MKNQLENWESGLGERMKEHEFAFDPAALAGFESLLAAENAVAGQPAGQPPAAPPVGGWLSGKLLALLAGTLVLGGLLYFGLTGRETSAVPEATPAVTTVPAVPAPEVTSPAPAVTETKAATPAPAVPASVTSPAPAAAPEKPASRAPLEMIVAPPARKPRPYTARAAPRPQPTSGMAAPRRNRRASMVAPLPETAVRQLAAPDRALPKVTVTPGRTATRDRKSLFPDVIDQRP